MYKMISQTKTPKTPRRTTEGKASKKPRICPDECVPPIILVDEHVAPIEPITIETECECPTVEEHALLELVEPVDTEPQEQEHFPIEVSKILCCCGSVIATKSLSKHEKTKKHLSFLESQESSNLVI